MRSLQPRKNDKDGQDSTRRKIKRERDVTIGRLLNFYVRIDIDYNGRNYFFESIVWLEREWQTFDIWLKHEHTNNWSIFVLSMLVMLPMLRSHDWSIDQQNIGIDFAKNAWMHNSIIVYFFVLCLFCWCSKSGSRTSAHRKCFLEL